MPFTRNSPLSDVIIHANNDHSFAAHAAVIGESSVLLEMIHDIGTQKQIHLPFTARWVNTLLDYLYGSGVQVLKPRMHTMLDHLNLITPEILEHFMKVILNRGLGAKSVFDIVHRYGSNFNVYFDDNDDTVVIAVLISSTHENFLNHFNRIVLKYFHNMAIIKYHISSIMLILIIRFILAIRGYKEYSEYVIWYHVHIMLRQGRIRHLPGLVPA
jgi:hypothetical protein